LAGLIAWASPAQAADDLRTIDGPREPDPDLERFFGKEGIDTIRTASRVDAFRLDPIGGSLKPGPPTAKEMLGFPITATRAKLPKDLVARIKAVVLRPQIYASAPGSGPPGVGVGKGCRFRPGLVFRFHAKGAKTVDAYLCFSCDDLGILRGNDLLTRGVAMGRLDLLAVAVEAFPNDGDLRGLHADTKARWGNRLAPR
jgi:hypothetical protein